VQFCLVEFFITVAVFTCFQDCRAKRPCNGLDYQSSANVPWNAPYHLNDCTTQSVCTESMKLF